MVIILLQDCDTEEAFYYYCRNIILTLRIKLKMKRFTLLALIALLVQTQLLAQLSAEQNPSGINWKKIRTNYFDIIVPEEMLAEGQRVANTLEYLRPSLEKTMYSRLHKWPVVLNSRSAVANGWVGYLPRMSEWYPAVPQDEFPGTLDWYHLLAVHEGRHMAQFDAFDRGFNRFAGICFGDLGLGAFTFFGTPLWFIEGDAVAIETALSNSGRGRQPIFDMGIRTLLLSGEHYSYYKAYLRSYKDYYPDYYALGYQLVTHNRREYGADTWSLVMRRSSKYSYWPYAFSRSMKKITGRNARQTYDDTMKELKTLWTEQIKGLEETPVEHVNQKSKKVWTNYKFPHRNSDGSIVALKTGLADPYTLVRLTPEGKEKRMIQIDYTERISANADKITWSVQNIDPRWWAQSFSEVIIYDIPSDTRQQITQKGRYFAPAMSPDGKQIAAVKQGLDRHCSLVLLNAKNGHEIREFPNPENYLIKTPVWSEDGLKMGFTRQRNGLRALTVLDVETGRQADIIPAGSEDITCPVFYGDYLLYDSPWSGIDNIYAVHIQTGQRYQLTSRKFGSFYPAPAGESLLFCDYQVAGMNIVSAMLDATQWTPIKQVEQRLVNYFEPLVEQEQGRNILIEDEIPQKQYPVEDYSPFMHSLNVHSWYLLPLPPYVFYGFLSNDLLNTLELGAHATYHAGEQVSAYSLSASYAGFRPIIDTEISFGKRTAIYDYQGRDTTDVWNEVKTTMGLRFPEIQNHGARTMFLQYELNGSLAHVSDKNHNNTDEPYNGNFQIMSHRIDFSTTLNKSRRDIYPRLATEFQIYYAMAFYDFEESNDLRFGSIRQYIPGIFKHHSLSGYLAGESTNDWTDYTFQSLMPRIRGYMIDADVLGSLNYSFPLFYPDFSVGSLLFIKRVRANLFYDYGLGDYRHRDDLNLYRSCGAELTFDFNPLTLYYLELNAGIRYSYRVEDADRVIEIILGSVAF